MKTLIFYGTTTGNTEVVAQKIAQLLQIAEKETEVKNVTDLTPNDLTTYDNLIAGSSTWDDGQLQSDMADFIDKFNAENTNLTGKKIAIFSLGDSGYPNFCASGELLKQTLIKQSVNQVGQVLQLDGFPDMEENQAKIKAWVEEIVQQL